MQSRGLYDFLAPVYARVMPGMFERVTARAVQRIRAGAPGNVLEVGIGAGRFLHTLAAKGGADLVGVDVSRRMLKQARRALDPDVPLVQADGRHLPFDDASFEGVVGLLFLGVLPPHDVEAGLAELTRIVAPGGRIIIASVKFTSPWVRRAWMTAYRVVPEIVGRLHPIDLNHHVEAAGLRVVRDEDIDEFAGMRLLTLVKVVG